MLKMLHIRRMLGMLTMTTQQICSLSLMGHIPWAVLLMSKGEPWLRGQQLGFKHTTKSL